MNQQQARRSERLRRKKQSTPGLSQPGNYSLYNNAYVVESEASYLPDPPRRTPKSSRRIRYKDSPHLYDTSPATENIDEQTGSVINRVRVSLFDILSSAARRPVNSTWRAAARSRVTQTEDEVVEDREDDQIETAVRNLEGEFDYAGPGSNKPISLLIVLLVASIGLLFILDGMVRARTNGGQSAWSSIKNKCAATAPYVQQVSAKGLAAGANVGRYLWRPAWRGARSESGVLTRAEFEQEILPDIMREARNAAVAEAVRVSQMAGSKWSGGQFGSFVERYAADKDLPADFALASMGASILWSRPSLWEEYFKFGRRYLQTFAGSNPISPALPKRAKSILEADVLPGNCWTFEGSIGEVAVKFGRPMKAKSVTLEHTPKSSVISTKSTPRRFGVKGLILNGDAVDLGEFEFDSERGHLQTFEVKRSERILRGILLQVKSNWGANHTAVYRFRVHGQQVAPNELQRT